MAAATFSERVVPVAAALSVSMARVVVLGSVDEPGTKV